MEDRGVLIKQVLNDSPAHTAGFAPADEWLGIEANSSMWRLQKLDDLLLYAAWGKKVTALISRDRQILQLPLTLPKAKEHTTWRLAIGEANKVKAWLN